MTCLVAASTFRSLPSEVVKAISFESGDQLYPNFSVSISVICLASPAPSVAVT